MATAGLRRTAIDNLESQAEFIATDAIIQQLEALQGSSVYIEAIRKFVTSADKFPENAKALHSLLSKSKPARNSKK